MLYRFNNKSPRIYQIGNARILPGETAIELRPEEWAALQANSQWHTWTRKGWVSAQEVERPEAKVDAPHPPSVPEQEPIQVSAFEPEHIEEMAEAPETLRAIKVAQALPMIRKCSDVPTLERWGQAESEDGGRETLFKAVLARVQKLEG